MDDAAEPRDVDERDDPLIGRVVAGKFALRNLIGSGASGAVYKADQIALGRTVAVKVLRQELARDARFVRRFHDEALAASRLNHPNVVSVIDYGQTEDDLLYLVMEYLRGPTLTEVLRGEPLPTSRIVDLVAQILAGLEEAHDAGVVHADLKSDNVVVEHRRNDWELVKVVDFGIARLAGTPSGGDGETICGTPEYMAPEIISGGEATFASDLYAVGVVVYELLTGTTPFAGGTSMDVLRRHLSTEPVRPSARRPGVLIDSSLDDLTLIALRKDPARRFASATEFRSALLRVQRAPAASASGERAVCAGCGVISPASFKFCPECGRPRGAVAEPPPPVVTRRRDSQPYEAVQIDRSDRVLGARGARARTTQSIGFLPLALYGRDRELAELVRFMRGGAAAPHALHLVGPIGVGKSRLLREAIGEAIAGQRLIVTGADPSGLRRTGYPIRAAVAALLGVKPSDEADIATRLVERGQASRDVPGLLELLGRDGPLRQLDPTARRREMIAALVRAFHRAAEEGPTIVVLDDLDGYDRPSQELAGRLLDAATASLRVIAVTAGDPEPPLPRAVLRLPLEPVRDESVAALSEMLLETGNPNVPALSDLRAGMGSPSHIRQLVRYAIEGGLADTAPSNPADLVAARLDLLPQEARLVCQAAAVLGVEAEVAVLRQLVSSAVDVDAALSVLDGRGLVLRTGDLARFDEQRVRDVTYDATPADVRRALHRDAAVALGDRASPALLGHHHLMAGELLPAIELLTRAGDDAVREQDDGAARSRYTAALGAARQLMLEDSDPVARGHFGDISVKLAEILGATGQLTLARGVLEEARFHCADARGVAAHLSRANAHVLAADGDQPQATAHLRAAIGQAITSGQRDLLCELYLDLATQCVRAGDVAGAISELGEAIDLVTLGEGGGARGGPQPLWRLLFRLAQLHVAAGDRTSAVQRAEEAIVHAERVSSLAGVARVQTMLAGLYDSLGKADQANYFRGLAVDVMRRLGDRRGTAELLLVGVDSTQRVPRIRPDALREAAVLAGEIGWSEGVSRARRASEPPEPGK